MFNGFTSYLEINSWHSAPLNPVEFIRCHNCFISTKYLEPFPKSSEMFEPMPESQLRIKEMGTLSFLFSQPQAK